MPAQEITDLSTMRQRTPDTLKMTQVTSFSPDTVTLTNGADKIVVIENRSRPFGAPTGLATSPQKSGGSLADGTYYYGVSAVNDLGESTPCTGVSAVVSGGGGSGSVDLTWVAPVAVNPYHPITDYKIYRGAAADSMTLLDTKGDTTPSYTDDGSLTPSGAPETSDGTGAACTVTVTTIADAYGRESDPSSINPFTVDAGAIEQVGGYPISLYGINKDPNIQLTLDCDDTDSIYIGVIDPVIQPYGS